MIAGPTPAWRKRLAIALAALLGCAALVLAFDWNWLRGPLEPFAREVLSPERIRRQNLLDPRAVTAVLDAHVAREADLSRQLWGLLSLSLWMDGPSDCGRGAPARVASDCRRGRGSRSA